jgi:hypothetical protein
VGEDISCQKRGENWISAVLTYCRPDPTRGLRETQRRVVSVHPYGILAFDTVKQLRIAPLSLWSFELDTAHTLDSPSELPASLPPKPTPLPPLTLEGEHEKGDGRVEQRQQKPRRAGGGLKEVERARQQEQQRARQASNPAHKHTAHEPSAPFDTPSQLSEVVSEPSPPPEHPFPQLTDRTDKRSRQRVTYLTSARRSGGMMSRGSTRIETVYQNSIMIPLSQS